MAYYSIYATSMQRWPFSSNKLFSHLESLFSIFCPFDILYSVPILPLRYFVFYILPLRYFAFDILPVRYFAFDILPLRYVVFDILFSIFCHIDILSFDILSFDILSFDILSVDILSFDILSVDILLSIICVRYFAFDILSVDILLFRYFAFRYYAIRYFAYSIFCEFDILSFHILRSIFCDSIFCHGSGSTPLTVGGGKSGVLVGRGLTWAAMWKFGDDSALNALTRTQWTAALRWKERKTGAPVQHSQASNYREPSRSEPTSSHDSRGARCCADADVPTTRDSLPLRCRQRCQSGSGKNDSSKDWERNALSEWMTRVTSVWYL